MKRVAVWAFYAVGALAIGYLALYAYAVFTGRDLQPGEPIRIFRRPDAPSYSQLGRQLASSAVSRRDDVTPPRQRGHSRPIPRA
jgi:hypothetical protein